MSTTKRKRPVPAEQRLLTSEEVAQRLGVTEKCLKNWRTRQKNSLPYIKAGSLVRYRLADVNAWIEQQTVRGESCGS